jgi:hypothetical protein
LAEAVSVITRALPSFMWIPAESAPGATAAVPPPATTLNKLGLPPLTVPDGHLDRN